MAHARQKRFSNIIGFDDTPFSHSYHGNIHVVGTVFANLRFDGVLIGEVEKDGSDAAEKLAELVAQSRFADHAQLIMLDGITLGGFNVVDVFHLFEQLKLPILVVTRRSPDFEKIREVLLTQIFDGKRKWAIIERLGQMDCVEVERVGMADVGHVYIQRVGLTLEQAHSVVKHFAIHSHIPEPIRIAHLIAGALIKGQSRGNP